MWLQHYEITQHTTFLYKLITVLPNGSTRLHNMFCNLDQFWNSIVCNKIATTVNYASEASWWEKWESMPHISLGNRLWGISNQVKDFVDVQIVPQIYFYDFYLKKLDVMEVVCVFEVIRGSQRFEWRAIKLFHNVVNTGERWELKFNKLYRIS